MANPRPWFRVHNEFRSDPKVRMMSDTDQIRLVLLWCLRNESGDLSKLTHDEIAYGLGITTSEWLRTQAIFLEKKFIDEDNNPRTWMQRQYISDSSTERVRRHRAAKKKGASSAPGENASKQEETTPAPPKKAAKAAKHSADPRHIACKEEINKYWKSRNKDEMPWDGAEGGALGKLLSASPDLTPQRLNQLLRNRYLSEVTHSDRPSKWLASIHSFANGALDRFGKPKGIPNARANSITAKSEIAVANMFEALGGREHNHRSINEDGDQTNRDPWDDVPQGGGGKIIEGTTSPSPAGA